MSLSTLVAESLPYLRRYARALAGSQSEGDGLVRATLEAAATEQDLRAELELGRVGLYRAFTKTWKALQAADADAPNTGTGGSGGLEQIAQKRLNAITPLNRQALLLTSLEGFNRSQAAQILELSSTQIDQLTASAVSEIEHESATQVLIIEDEPLISIQLEDLVKSLGHTISGTAATHKQSLEAVEENAPGLVLADIQLADGSSGLDAVDDILEIGDVPVIFITAYPERLLTGNRPEPTYLVTKPFEEQTVRAAISQALFFNPNSIS